MPEKPGLFHEAEDIAFSKIEEKENLQFFWRTFDKTCFKLSEHFSFFPNICFLVVKRQFLRTLRPLPRTDLSGGTGVVDKHFEPYVHE
jgi:hypothetical protein